MNDNVEAGSLKLALRFKSKECGDVTDLLDSIYLRSVAENKEKLLEIAGKTTVMPSSSSVPLPESPQ